MYVPQNLFSIAFHQVENTLYKLHNDVLTLNSALFKDMFTIGDAGFHLPLVVEVKSGTDPIFLEGEQQAVFNLFLDHINGRWVFTIY